MQKNLNNKLVLDYLNRSSTHSSTVAGESSEFKKKKIIFKKKNKIKYNDSFTNLTLKSK